MKGWLFKRVACAFVFFFVHNTRGEDRSVDICCGFVSLFFSTVGIDDLELVEELLDVILGVALSFHLVKIIGNILVEVLVTLPFVHTEHYHNPQDEDSAYEKACYKSNQRVTCDFSVSVVRVLLLVEDHGSYLIVSGGGKYSALHTGARRHDNIWTDG